MSYGPGVPGLEPGLGPRIPGLGGPMVWFRGDLERCLPRSCGGAARLEELDFSLKSSRKPALAFIPGLLP